MENETPFAIDGYNNITPTGPILIRYNHLRGVMENLIPDSVTRAPLIEQADCITGFFGQIINDPRFDTFIAGDYASGIVNPEKIDLYIIIPVRILNLLDSECREHLMKYVDHNLDNGREFKKLFKHTNCRLHILPLPETQDKDFIAELHRKRLEMAKIEMAKGIEERESGYFQMDLNDDEDTEDDD